MNELPLLFPTMVIFEFGWTAIRIKSLFSIGFCREMNERKLNQSGHFYLFLARCLLGTFFRKR